MITEIPKRKYALAAMGEIMLRLSPVGKERISASDIFEKNVGGAELNVASGVAALGLSSAIISRIPGSEIGKYVRKKVRAHGVSDEYLLTDGSHDARLGIYYYESGAYPRQPMVSYDRRLSSFTALSSRDLSREIYSSASIFHTSGIAAALSPDLSGTVIDVAEQFKESGAIVSFDVNYRAALWSEEEARRTVMEILPITSVLFVSEETARRMLGMKGELRDIHRRLAERFPSLEIIASTRRCAITPGRHDFSSLVYDCRSDCHFEEAEYKGIEVVDRIGSGDAYIAGALYALIKHRSIEAMTKYGNAMAAIKSTVSGDTAACDLEDLWRVIRNHGEGQGSEIVR